MLAAPPSRDRDAVVPVTVDVTFLKQPRPPTGAGPKLPADTRIERLPRCTVAFYRFLYGTVGRDYCWWLRRAAPNAELEAILGHPGVSVHVLYRHGEPAGFYELDRRKAPAINLSYFGLRPHVVGHGLGRALLRHAVDTCWAERCAAITVNTCTADHPRALPNYLEVGFEKLRTVRESWRIPARLNLPIPAHLRRD